MSTILEYKEKYPLYKNIRDDKLAGIIYDKTPSYQKLNRLDFVRHVSGIDISKDVPPPRETILSGLIGDAKQSVQNLIPKQILPLFPKFREDVPVEAQPQGKDDYKSKIRQPYQSELEFFKRRPEVAGMATEDKRIILNPYNNFNEKQKDAVARLENFRLLMNEKNIIPDFELTDKQKEFFKGTEYETNQVAAKQSIVSRILVGDPSAQDITPEQERFANDFGKSVAKGTEGLTGFTYPPAERKRQFTKEGAEFITGTLEKAFLPFTAPITIGANILQGLIRDIKGTGSQGNVDAIGRILTLNPKPGDQIFVADILKEIGVTDESASLPEGTIDRIGFIADWPLFGGVAKLQKMLANTLTSKFPAKTFNDEIKVILEDSIGKTTKTTEEELLKAKFIEPVLESIKKKRKEILKLTEEGKVIDEAIVPHETIQTKSVLPEQLSPTKLFKNVIPEEGKGTGKKFEPFTQTTENIIKEEAGLIKEEISKAVAGENLYVKDEFGVTTEVIKGGIRSTFPPYFAELKIPKKDLIKNIQKIIDGTITAKDKETKWYQRLTNLIQKRIEGIEKRFTPETGREDPFRINETQGRSKMSPEDAAFEEVSDFFAEAKAGLHGEFGGFAKSDIAQKPPLVEMPELVEIAKNITGKYPGIKKNLIRGMQALGTAKVREGAGSATINLFAGMFKDPIVAAKVLAHEIGHVVDWLPQKTLSRGNILGKIGSLRKYMKQLLEEYPGAPGALTAKDRAKIRRIAEKMAKEGQKAAPEVTPEDVLSIWRDVKSFEKNRALNDYIAKLSREQKSEIMKAAIKGKLPDWANFGQVYKDAEPEIKKIYQKLLEEEIEKLRLIERDVILKELKALTQKWKPFKEGLNPSYTKYRYSNDELYADAVSVLLNDSELLKNVSPNFYKAFFNYLERKPEFKKSYLDILERGKRGRIEILRKRDKDIDAMFNKEENIRAKLLKPEPRDIFGVIKKELVDINAPRIKKLKEAQKKGIKINPADNPIYWAEEYPYTHAAYYEYLRTVQTNVRTPLKKARLSDKDMGKYLMYRRIITERAEIANPLGHTPETAANQLEFMKASLGEERFALIEEAAKRFSETRADHILPILKKADMYDPVLQNAIENNIDTYAKFEVLGYLENKFGKDHANRLYQQVGTLQDIANPFTSTLIQDAALMRAAAIKMERNTFVDMMGKAFPNEIIPAKTQWNGKFHAPIESKDPKMGMVTYLHQGKVQGYYLPKEIADNFLKGNLEAGKIVRALGYLTAPLKAIFVSKNPFWITWNIQRDVRALAKNLPGSNLPKTLWYVTKSLPDAFKDVFLKQSTKDVSEMYKQKMLIVGRYYRALDQGTEIHMDKVMRSYGLSGKEYENKVITPFVKLWDSLDKPGQFSERVVKIAGFKQLKALQKNQIMQGVESISNKKIGHDVRVLVGTPDPLRKGHLSPLYNNIFLFSNMGKEGWRSSLEAAKATPLSYTWKTMKYDILPKILVYGGSAGYLGPKIKRMYDNIPDNDKTNYITIPLGFTSSGKTAYMVIPHDFMGQAIAGVFWKSINTRKTEDIQELFDFTMGGLPYSSLNPILGTIMDTQRYISGKNPYDSWSGRDIIPESVFAAGGTRSHKEFSKHLWNTFGGGIVYRFKYDTVEKVQDEFEKLYGIPLVGTGLRRFIRVSDYGVREKLRDAKEEVRKTNANDLLDAKDVLYKLIDNKELTDADKTALLKKPGVLGDIAILKLTGQKYGLTALEEYLSASTAAEGQAVLKKWDEINKDYPAPNLINK